MWYEIASEVLLFILTLSIIVVSDCTLFILSYKLCLFETFKRMLKSIY